MADFDIVEPFLPLLPLCGGSRDPTPPSAKRKHHFKRKRMSPETKQLKTAVNKNDTVYVKYIMMHSWKRSSNFASRRAILRWGATAAAATFTLLKSTSGHTAAEQVETQFLSWSRIATGFADLSAGTSREFLETSLRSGTTVTELLKLDPLEYRGTAVEKRLLEAWYSGIFKLDEADTVRNAETALIWQAAGIDPQPSWCAGAPNIWTAPPSNL